MIQSVYYFDLLLFILQLSLPEGVSVDIVVSSIVDAGRIFVQQPTHPSYTSLDRLNTFMNQCYMRDGTVPDIPRPIECKSLFHTTIWSRNPLIMYVLSGFP